jgi:2-methylcitrate dehydratase PrpD
VAFEGPSPETTLASWISALTPGDIADPVAERVELLLLDALASAIAGRSTVDVAAMEAAARGFGGDGDVTIIGGGRLAPAGACLLNAYQTTAATVCDVHRPTLCHVTPVVVPPALALAELRDRSGAALLTALAAGFETTVRVGLATDYPVLRFRGWHAPGVVGPFGGAAAAASLLGLGATATRDALAFGGSQAAGTFAGLGTSQVKFHQARGAVSGLLAGLVAEAGFDASPRILTAPDGGLLTTYAAGGDPGRLIDGLGTAWELLGISLRRWPGASALQPVIQASLQLVAGDGDSTGPVAPRVPPHVSAPAAAEVARIRVDLPEGSFRLNGEAAWDDQLGAFQSARWVAAVVLHDRSCWLEQFSPERLADRDLDRYARERVDVQIDRSLPPGGAAVRYELLDGSSRTARIEAPMGDPAAPLARADVVAKLRQATSGQILSGRADAIVDAVSGLRSAPTVRPLLAALRH